MLRAARITLRVLVHSFSKQFSSRNTKLLDLEPPAIYHYLYISNTENRLNGKELIKILGMCTNDFECFEFLFRGLK